MTGRLALSLVAALALSAVRAHAAPAPEPSAAEPPAEPSQALPAAPAAPEVAPEVAPATSHSPAVAAVLVENTTASPVTVELPVGPARVVPAGGRELVEGLAPGAQRLTATADGGARHAVTLTLAAGQRYTWTLFPARATVRVVNRTPDRLVAYLGDERRGELDPGATLLLDRLPAAAFELELVDQRATARYTEIFDPSRVAASTWVVTPAVGAVAVRNDRPEALALFVDGRALGHLEARAQRTFGGVPVGPRLLEARGARSGRVLRAALDVREDASSSAHFTDPTATLEIANMTSSALRPTAALAAQHPTVPPGETRSFAVSAQAGAWVLLGDGGARHELSAEPAASEVVRWEVRAAATALIVWNRLDEEVAVAVDDRAVGLVPAGGTAAFEGVVPGRRRFTALGVGTGRSREHHELARADTPVRWTLDLRPGRVIVRNTSAEAVEVAIDGRRHDRVEAGTSRAFPNLVPGEHEVVATGATSRLRHAVLTPLDEGADALVVVPAATGVLLVDNASGQDVDVRVDGQLAGRVRADAGPTPLSVAAGKHLVQVERRGDRRVTGVELQISPHHTVHLPVPRPLVRLVLVNQTAEALTVRLGQRVLATLDPQSSAMIEDAPAGVHELAATDASGRVTHVERRTLFAGDTATWVLQSAP